MYNKPSGNIKRRSWFYMTVILLTLCLLFAGCKDEKSDTEKVDAAVDKILSAEDFQKLDQDSKSEQLRQALEKLVEDDVIKEDTIVYDSDGGLISFRYEDGSLGGVYLKEFDDRLNQGMSAVSQSESQPAVTQGMTALVLNGFEDEPFRRDYYEDLEQDWDAKGLQTTVDTDVTVADLKALSGNDVVVFAMHGSEYEGVPVLCVNEQVTAATDKAYSKEIQSGQIARITYWDETVHYWVLDDLFTAAYDSIDCDLIYSESCMFYGCDCTTDMDRSFAETLAGLAEGTVIGYHNSVEAEYSRNVMKATVDHLLEGDTYGQALESAIAVYGADDDWHEPEIHKFVSFPVLTGSTTDRLIKIPVSDFSVPEDMVLTIGELSVIEPEILPENASDYTIAWFSSDETVATVSPTGEAGILTSHAKGTAVITAELTSGGRTITRSTQIRVASKARDTVLVLDISGSMYGQPLEEMKKSAIQFCNDLLTDEFNNRVGLVFYDDDIITVDLTGDLDMLVGRIQAITDGGRTNMEGGLSAADAMLSSSGKADAIKNVVIMADGLPNEGKTSSSGSMPSGSYSGYYTSISYANAVIDTARDMMNRYNIYSLGFFHGLYEEEKEFATALMQELTNKTDGYHQVDKAEDLQFAFGDISEEISVGSKIVINIACPVDVKVSYGGEMLSSSGSAFCDATSFGTLQLLGKDQDIKVVSLDSDKEYEIEIVGTGTGKMDYSVHYYDEKEQLSDYRSFEAVPITATTVIKSDTDNISKDITLDVDEDGDGVVDVIWTAITKSKGQVTYEKDPPKPEEPATIPTEPEDENRSGQEEKDPVVLSPWVIGVIGTVVFVLACGGAVALMLIGRKNGDADDTQPDEEDGSAAENGDAEENIRFNIVMCPVCHKAHPSDKPCDCQISKERITEDAERTAGVIQITGGSLDGLAVPVKDGETLYLGKDPKAANIVFTNDYLRVSRLHCAVTYSAKANKYYVVDSSANGTYFTNKTRLEKGKRTPVEANTVLLLADEACTIWLG